MVKVRYLIMFLIISLAVSVGEVYAQNLDINDQSGEVNDTISFTVSINSAPNAVGAMQFDVSYDTSVLDFINNFTKGDLVSGFSYFDVSEVSSGQIRVAGITTSDLGKGSSGEVVKLEFTVKSCANTTLTLTGLEDDLSGWSTGGGQFSCTSTTATPTPTASQSPIATPKSTPTPAVCEAERIAVSYRVITLKRKKSSYVTVTVTGADGCAVEGETVTAKVVSGKKSVKLSASSETTDTDGKAIFTITATKKTGVSRIRFEAGVITATITVNVRK